MHRGKKASAENSPHHHRGDAQVQAVDGTQSTHGERVLTAHHNPNTTTITFAPHHHLQDVLEGVRGFLQASIDHPGWWKHKRRMVVRPAPTHTQKHLPVRTPHTRISHNSGWTFCARFSHTCCACFIVVSGRACTCHMYTHTHMHMPHATCTRTCTCTCHMHMPHAPHNIVLVQFPTCSTVSRVHGGLENEKTRKAVRRSRF